jgi:hypothetical protein
VLLGKYSPFNGRGCSPGIWEFKKKDYIFEMDAAIYMENPSMKLSYE